MIMILSSCEFDDAGDLHITDTGWIIIIAFCVVFIFSLIKGYIEKKKEDDFNAYVEEQRTKELLKRKEEEEAKRAEQEAIYKSIAEEYRNCASMDIEVKGIFARSARAKDLVPILNVNDEIKLRPEPTNPYDPYAVKVMCDRIHLGYVPAEDSKLITELIIQKNIKRVVVKFAGDSRIEPWDKPDPYLILTIYYDDLD